MAKTIKQYVYNNNSQEVEELLSGEDSVIRLLENKRILQIGIQALPGAKFYLNNTEYAIIVGHNGYFEINISSGIIISNVYIARSSLSLLQNNESAYILIDTIEEKED